MKWDKNQESERNDNHFIICGIQISPCCSEQFFFKDDGYMLQYEQLKYIVVIHCIYSFFLKSLLVCVLIRYDTHMFKEVFCVYDVS